MRRHCVTASRRILTIQATRSVVVPNDAVWRVLGDFGTEHRWSRTLSKCERDTPDVRVGTTRVCTLPRPVMGRTEARERLVEFDPGRALAYVLDGSAGPFSSAGSRWSTRVDAAGRTEITVEGRFEPKNALVKILVWPLARLYVRRLIRRTLVELEAFLTVGRAAQSAT